MRVHERLPGGPIWPGCTTPVRPHWRPNKNHASCPNEPPTIHSSRVDPPVSRTSAPNTPDTRRRFRARHIRAEPLSTTQSAAFGWMEMPSLAQSVNLWMSRT